MVRLLLDNEGGYCSDEVRRVGEVEEGGFFLTAFIIACSPSAFSNFFYLLASESFFFFCTLLSGVCKFFFSFFFFSFFFNKQYSTLSFLYGLAPSFLRDFVNEGSGIPTRLCFFIREYRRGERRYGVTSCHCCSW